MRAPVVLDEDEWTEAVELIIERDYFPDIPKMQNKLEWLQVPECLLSAVDTSCDMLRSAMRNPESCLASLGLWATGPRQRTQLLAPGITSSCLAGTVQAVRSRDPELLRQAQLNIAQRRAGIKTPVGQSPAIFATPGGMSSFRMPASLLRTPAGAQTPRLDGQAVSAIGCCPSNLSTSLLHSRHC